MITHAPFLTTRVIDGDTIAHELTLQFSTRILGVDCPEMHDPRQYAAASVVKRAVEQWVEKHRVLTDLAAVAFDKYGSRVDAEVWGVDAEGHAERLSSWLLKQGYAHPYGGGTKQPWTDAELQAIVASAGKQT